MKFPDSLRALFIDRLTKNQAWFADNYAAAVERVKDHSGDPDPYWESQANEMSACPGPVLLDEFGGEETPTQARERAFELLALADLAEIAEIPPEPGCPCVGTSDQEDCPHA